MKEVDGERQSIINRLNRIEGQVKGIRKMVEEEQNCAEILMQVAAVKAAINKVGTIVFQTHFRRCLEAAVRGEQDLAFVDDVMKMLTKYIS